jgi:hypothetical protein
MPQTTMLYPAPVGRYSGASILRDQTYPCPRAVPMGQNSDAMAQRFGRMRTSHIPNPF